MNVYIKVINILLPLEETTYTMTFDSLINACLWNSCRLPL
jgi:hypothetical protein